MSEKATEAATVDVAAIVKDVTEKVAASFKTQIDELAKNQKIFADTFETELKKLGEKAAGEPSRKADATGAEPQTVAKLVADALAERDAAAAEKARSAEAAKAARTKVGLEKLFGNADLVDLLPDTADEAQLIAAAEKLAATAKKLKPDFGNAAAKDGGTVPGTGEAAKVIPPGNLTPGAAKFAASITLPK